MAFWKRKKPEPDPEPQKPLVECGLPPNADTRWDVELLRIWIVDGRLLVSVRADTTDEPGAWGIQLVDQSRHIAHAWQQIGGQPLAETLTAIRGAFDRHWEERPDMDPAEHVTVVRGGAGPLPVPDEAPDAEMAREIARIWSLGDTYDLCLMPEALGGAAPWGMIAADLIHFVGHALATDAQPEPDVRAEIRHYFDAEWHNPTDIHTGEIVDDDPSEDGDA